MSEKKPAIIHDIWNAILNDLWMWVVVWGSQRCGKTSFKMQVAYEVYKDWDKVLQSFVFNLSGLLYKMDKGEPERVPTLNKLHMRVPIILFDDWGGSSNKAYTQYDKSWDIFKGGFDLLGTKLSVLMASMVDPAEPTYQLQQKYTHEIFITKRGVYKYDRVVWGQDFSGWKPRKRKEWVETNYFEPVPDDVYKQYDEMRLSLVDEMEQRIKDSMVETQTEAILKRLQSSDLELMQLLLKHGPIDKHYKLDKLPEKYREALIRCKARNLIIPIRKGTTYWYDVTDLGLEALKRLEKEQNELFRKSEMVAIELINKH